MIAVKICGLRQFEEACVAVEHGADLLGFVFEPGSPRYVGSPHWSPDWLEALPVPKVAVYGVAGIPPPGFDWVQAHTWPVADGRPKLRVARLQGERWVGGRPHLDPKDRLLVDAYSPTGHGGTGLQVQWEALAGEREQGEWWLAGGLNPDNVVEAIRLARPYGVDVSSGVESEPGVKSLQRIREFIERAKAAS